MAVNALLGMGLLQVLKILPTNACISLLWLNVLLREKYKYIYLLNSW